jgi:O-antigen/teichoic acid export membrane protein
VGAVRHEFGQLLRHVSWRRLRAVAHKYRAFPAAYLPGGYISMASGQLPVFMLAPVFGSTAVGLYSFSLSLLELPFNVLGVAIGPVFAQKAAETYQQDPRRLPGLTLNLYYKLLYLGLLPFSLVTVYGDVIFRVLFGPKWEMAGVITSYLGFYYVFKLLSVGTSGLYAILDKQRYYLYSNIFLFGMRALGLGIGAASKDLNLTLLLFGMGSLIATFAVDLHVLSLLRLPIWRIAFRTVALVGLSLLAIKLSRWGLAHYLPALR